MLRDPEEQEKEEAAKAEAAKEEAKEPVIPQESWGPGETVEEPAPVVPPPGAAPAAPQVAAPAAPTITEDWGQTVSAISTEI